MLTPAPSAETLDARVATAEAALQQAALGRPDALALLETAVARLADCFDAQTGAAFVGAGEGEAFVRCAVAGAVPEADALVPWPGLLAEASVLTPDVSAAAGLLAAFGADGALALPVRGAAPAVLVLARDAPFAEAERLAGARLAALFSTLWAWTDAEARFQRTVADLDDALFTFGHDAAGRRAVAFVTPQIEALTGLDPDALLAGDADWADLVHADDRTAFAAHDAHLRAGDASRIDVRLVLAHGETVWVSERATPGVDAAGRPTASGILTDVTAQKRAEATLDHARRVAERAAEARMAFLRLMSHELRTPLGAIRGFAELLAEEVEALPDAPAVVAEFTHTIGDAATRALRLVSDLLDLARLETGSLDIARTPVDLAALTRAAASRVAPGLSARGVVLVLDAPAEAIASADSARVEQILAGLLANAAAFTAQGRVSVSVSVSEQTATVAITDTGVGMDEVFLEALFEPFVQEDVRVNRDREGTGLGLAIARRLAEAMGGSLSAQSEKGKGSSFTLVLKRHGA